MRRMKMAALAAALTLLAGCAQQPGGITVTESGSETQANIPMGRYVELEWTLPDSRENLYVSKMQPVGDGFDIGIVAFENERPAARYHSEDGETWEPVDEALLSALPVPEDWNVTSLDWSDEAYLALIDRYFEKDGDYGRESKLYRGEPGGEWVEIPVDWGATQAESGSSRSRALYPDNAEFGPDNTILFGDQLGGLARYSGEGKLVNSYPVSWMGALLDGSVAKLDVETAEIVTYDLATEEELERTPVDAGAMGDGYPLLFGGTDGLYLAGTGGLWRLTPEGTLFERMVDGASCSLGKPALSVSRGCAAPDGSFLIAVREDGLPKLLHYRYDESIPSRPDKELSVASLEMQPLVHQAAIEFQVANPDVAVTVRELYDPESAMTKADALRQLNTELLAGKGPDVLVLDGMPLRSYEEKGVLADLSEVAQGANLQENVALSLKAETGLFAIPARFGVTLMIGRPERLAKARTLPELAAMASSEPDTRMLYDVRPEGLMKMYFPACYPSMAQEGGKLDEGKLAEFLEAVKALSESGAGVDFTSDFDDWGEDPSQFTEERLAMAYESMGGVRFAYGKVQLTPATMYGFLDFRFPYAAMMKLTGETPAPDSTLDYLAPLPGLEEGTNTFEPFCLLGVNKAGDVETAKRFVGQALSESVQSSRLDGFAVEKNALAGSIDRQTNTSGSWHDPDGVDDGLHIECTPAEAQQPLFALFDSLDEPVIEDGRLWEILSEETEAFFAGSVGAQQAAAAVAGRVEAYLAE